MHALAAREHGKARQSKICQPVTNMHRGSLYRLEVQPLVRVEVKYHPIGPLNRVAARRPRVELDRTLLDALQYSARILDIKVILGSTVFLADSNVMDGIPERAVVMLLKKAFAGAALGAADQADRTVPNEGQHDVRNRLIIIGKIALGLAAVGEYHAFAVGDLDPCITRWGGSRLLPLDRRRGLVATKPKIAAMPNFPIAGELRKGHFGDQLRRDPDDTAFAALVHLDSRGFSFEPGKLGAKLVEIVAGKAGANVAIINELASLMLRHEQRSERPPLGR